LGRTGRMSGFRRGRGICRTFRYRACGPGASGALRRVVESSHQAGSLEGPPVALRTRGVRRRARKREEGMKIDSFPSIFKVSGTKKEIGRRRDGQASRVHKGPCCNAPMKGLGYSRRSRKRRSTAGSRVYA
jgi:hypothetical protein